VGREELSRLTILYINILREGGAVQVNYIVYQYTVGREEMSRLTILYINILREGRSCPG